MINDPYYAQDQGLVQNPNQLQYNAINPTAMSNMQTLQNINGTQVPNTFNRTVGTPFVGAEPSAQYNTPVAPIATPKNVRTQIMPNNNLQTY
jgi:hypothetical protein